MHVQRAGHSIVALAYVHDAFSRIVRPHLVAVFVYDIVSIPRVRHAHVGVQAAAGTEGSTAAASILLIFRGLEFAAHLELGHPWQR